MIVSSWCTIGALHRRSTLGLLTILLGLHRIARCRINWPVVGRRKATIAIVAIGLLLREIGLLNVWLLNDWLLILLLGAWLLVATRRCTQRWSGWRQLGCYNSWLNIQLRRLDLNRRRRRWWWHNCPLLDNWRNCWRSVFFSEAEFWFCSWCNLLGR